MKFSPALKWFLVILLPLTFAWKLPVRDDELHDYSHEIKSFLLSRKFVVTDLRQRLNGMRVIKASSGACQMLVARASPDGWDQDLVHNLATSADQVYIVFDGELYRDHLGWLVTAGYLRSKIFYKLKLESHVKTVIAVAAAPICHTEQLPWEELRNL